MRAILEDMRTGTVRAYDVPQPELRPGGILVRTAFSAVSSGTERAVVEAGEMSLLSKARTRPDLVKKVLDTARTDGLRAAYEKVQTRLNTLTPMGYSAAGIVQAVGEGVHEFQVGERVACAGVGFANHSEINWVPRNLAVHVPASVSLEAASLTTIAAIALQGLRQAQVALGETVAVVGAGLVGVLTIQLARAAGCRVIAVDADASRVDKALALGAHLALQASDPRLAIAVRDFSRYGADAAIVTASSSTAEPLELAADIMRDRGRIVIVGDVNMGVSRRSVYPKEISITMSRSYGPGRYDPAYELDGNDYPVGYVRWTERRNMEAVLDLQATGAVDFQPLLQKRCPIEEGERAYADLLAGKDYTVIFEYGSQERKAETAAPRISAVRPKVSGRLRVGCIGASGFARNSIFPHLKADVVVSLASVASGSGVGAESAKRSFGFARTQTPTESIQDPELDALFIVTPNQHHAEYASAGLRAGKAVFVEKPLAVDQQQLNLIRRAYFEAESSGRRPFLTVGFNRRFAPLSERIKSFFSGRQEPMAVHIRVNAGYLPAEHPRQQNNEGGRIIGELCHFVDWARWIVGAEIQTVNAAALPDGSRYKRDNLAVTLGFADGSLANILYLANGDPAVPKEFFEVFCEGAVARLDDFRVVELVRNAKTQHFKSARDKGYRRELQATLKAMVSGENSPIPFEQLTEVTEACFAIAKALQTGQSISVSNSSALPEASEPALSSGVAVGDRSMADD